MNRGDCSNETSGNSYQVLVVDDDPGLAEALSWQLRDAGVCVSSAVTGANARRLTATRINFLVLDLRLPDMNGLDVLPWFPRVPFAVVSGFMETEAAVRAARLGACEVIDKPVEVDRLAAVIARTILESPQHPVPLSVRGPGSKANRPAAEAWANCVLRASASDADLNTIRSWAHHAGTSRTTLIDRSRLVGMSARDARDFTRALRAVIRAEREGCDPKDLIDVRDRRTLKSFLQRTGLAIDGKECITVEAFLIRQRLVPPDSEAMAALRRLLAAMARPRQ